MYKYLYNHGKIRGKTLKEWRVYCSDENVPIKTMKYITALEETLEKRNKEILEDTSFENWLLKYKKVSLKDSDKFIKEYGSKANKWKLEFKNWLRKNI